MPCECKQTHPAKVWRVWRASCRWPRSNWWRGARIPFGAVTPTLSPAPHGTLSFRRCFSFHQPQFRTDPRHPWWLLSPKIYDEKGKGRKIGKCPHGFKCTPLDERTSQGSHCYTRRWSASRPSWTPWLGDSWRPTGSPSWTRGTSDPTSSSKSGRGKRPRSWTWSRLKIIKSH